jgi:hypothetical protein
VILEQGIPVTGIRFITHFGCDPVTSGSCGKDVEPLVKMWGHLGFTVRCPTSGQDYIDMVKNPVYGRGKNMNPCVDCRIMMISWAREALDREGAGFPHHRARFLNQRPMSQTWERFRQIDRQLGLEGLVVRPLSGKDPSRDAAGEGRHPGPLAACSTSRAAAESPVLARQALRHHRHSSAVGRLPA